MFGIESQYKSKTKQRKIIIHHNNIPNDDELYVVEDVLEPGFNYTVNLRKTSRQRLSHPYGQCTTDSHIQCYRKCIQSQHKRIFKCIPLFVINYMHESDFNSLDTDICHYDSLSKRKNFGHKFKYFCYKQCPKDCFTVEYNARVVGSEIPIIESRSHDSGWSGFHHDTSRVFKQSLIGWHSGEAFEPEEPDIDTPVNNVPVERRFVWDSSELMFAYIEEPVITLTDYLVHCGGLMGLWFGHSLRDLFRALINFVKNAYYKIKLVCLIFYLICFS